MTKIYITKVYDVFEKKIFENMLLSDELKEKIINTKSEQLQTERKAAYSLLTFALSENGFKNFSIQYNDNGKPYIKDEKFAISISHNNSVTAVALSDEYESIGIDIELITEKNEMSSDRFLNRYMKDVVFLKEIKFIEAEEIKYFGKEKLLLQNKDDGVFTSIKKWCVTEAVLKCEGGGFSSLPIVTDLFKQISVQSEIISLGDDKYMLAIAKDNK